MLTRKKRGNDKKRERNARLLRFARNDTVKILLLFCIWNNLARAGELKGAITLSGAWAIYPTAVAWAQGFQKKHPGMRVDVSAGGAGKGAADAIAGLVDIGMVSREPDPSEIKRGIIPIFVLHDAVFPVMNAENPSLRNLLKKGIDKNTWIDMYINGRSQWHIYTRSDSCGAAAAWAKYLGDRKQEDLHGIGIYGDPGILEAVRKDRIGIGYSNFGYVFTRQGAVMPGLKIIPIDADENGAAGPDEVFESRAAAVRAIESGKYPVRRKNYFYVKGTAAEPVKEFIRFVLSEEGTGIVEKVGTSLPLPREERARSLRKMDSRLLSAGMTERGNAGMRERKKERKRKREMRE